MVPTPQAWLGILTRARTYYDVRQALAELGLDDGALHRYGVRILKIGMLFPMEPRIVRDFARGLQEVLVVEEKRWFLELFCKDVLYGLTDRPQVVGKLDEEDRPLLSPVGELDSDLIARAIARRLARRVKIDSVEARIQHLDELKRRPKTLTLARTAFFCSGCRTTAPPSFPRAAWPPRASAATAWRWGWTAASSGSPTWARRARSGSASRRSPRRRTSSRTSATGPSSTRAASRSTTRWPPA